MCLPFIHCLFSCSICIKKQIKMFFVPSSDFKILEVSIHLYSNCTHTFWVHAVWFLYGGRLITSCVYIHTYREKITWAAICSTHIHQSTSFARSVECTVSSFPASTLIATEWPLAQLTRTPSRKLTWYILMAGTGKKLIPLLLENLDNSRKEYHDVM